MPRWRGAGLRRAALALAVVAAAAPMGAQRPAPRPTTRPPASVPARDTTAIRAPVTSPRDSARRALPRDTTGGRDSAAGRDTTRRSLVDWAETDSVMQALLARPGYEATRYQGDRVTFTARGRALYIEGVPSAVGRGESVIVGDTIVYSDSLQIIQVRGDTVYLRDPTYQADDVVARRYLEYDLARRIGTVRELSTAIESGQRWIVHGTGGAQFVTDTSAARRNAFYVRNGEITSCEHADPHYHFAAGEIKVVAKNLMVARPAVLYIGNVPVFWLPFIFQDMRSGRRSGMLTPRFGVSELLRNSPTYRRQVDNVGYYFALNDYMDAQVAFDWRSSARANGFDPGFMRYRGQLQYNWIDRFVGGSLGASYDHLRDGRRNTSVSLTHSQSFSQQTRLSAVVNYSTNTTVRQSTHVNDVYAPLSTIRSQANYSTVLGPLSFQAGGSRVQYPGRPQVDLDFPTLSVTTQGPLNLAEWLVWTPSATFGNRIGTKQPYRGSSTPFTFRPGANGGLDSSRTFSDTRNTSASFSTPLRIFDFNWNNSFTFAESEDDYPQTKSVQGITATGDTVTRTRFFDRYFNTSLDWNTSVELPRLLQGSWNVVPSVGFSNVTGDAFFLRSTLSGGEWVRQAKRVNYGASASPTFFALLPGAGPITRLRHSLTPVLSWRYSPDARGRINPRFLEAANIQQRGFLGLLAENQVSLSLAQNIEAKLRASPTDSSPDGGRKIKLLSLNLTPITYDFVRADTVGNGLTNRTFEYSARSDLLPGLDLRVQYSLFQGNPESDTAVFKPYRENVGANFSLNRNSAIFAAIGRLLGRYAPTAAEVETSAQGTAEQALVTRQVASQNVAGSDVRPGILGVASAGQGWQLTMGYAATRQRPPTGSFTLAAFDPVAICESFRRDGFAYQRCLDVERGRLAQQQADSSTFNRGQGFVRVEPTQTVTGALSFNVTPKWAAQWSTSYDAESRQFALHQVQLQRELHDWRAIFGFNQTQSGAFSFNFLIALNAQPELKFDYQRRSFRPQGF